MAHLKRITWTDDDDWERAVLLPYSCPEDRVELGIPSEVPDISQLDWMAIQRDLHNALMNEGLLTWNDVQSGQGRINVICRRVLARRVLDLYRQTGGLINE